MKEKIFSPYPVIFTDLDGTLLSETTNEIGPAFATLRHCCKLGVPIIFCSSKTAPEIIALRESLSVTDPFICENGGAVYLPKGVFPYLDIKTHQDRSFDVIEIGTPVSQLRQALKRAAKETGAVVRGMGEMNLDEICTLTGLTRKQAILAKERRYDEPFVLLRGNEDALKKSIAHLGFNMTRGGHFLHILGGSDKGKATHVLSDLYRKKIGDVITIGLGDAENDLPLFKAVDWAFLIQKPSGTWESLPPLSHLRKVQKAGPLGWAQAVTTVLKEFSID